MAYPLPEQMAGQDGRQGWALHGHQGWGLTFSTSPLPMCLAQNVFALSAPLQLHGPSSPQTKNKVSLHGLRVPLSNGQRSSFLEMSVTSKPLSSKALSAKSLQWWGAHTLQSQGQPRCGERFPDSISPDFSFSSMTPVMMSCWGAVPLPQRLPRSVSAMIAVAGPATALGGFDTSISLSAEP